MNRYIRKIFFSNKIMKDLKLYLFKTYDHYKKRERKIHLGTENPDKTFYVIGDGDTTAGLIWIVNKALMHISYAIEHNYIPVIDYKNNKTQYTGDDAFGKINMWEEYFKQPAGYTLEDISNSKNIIISRREPTPDKKHHMGHFYDDERKIEYFRNYFQEYIHFSESVDKYLKNSEKLLSGRCVGVVCRGTDYVVNKPVGHPIPPSPSQVIKKVLSVIQEYHCDKIFLATEDNDILDEFKTVFGDKLIVNHQKRVTKGQLTSGKLLAYTKMQISSSNHDRYMSGLEYLEAVYLLSKCQCFVGSRCGATKAALLMTKGYEYKYIFDLGLY